jgi:hypothetical protein
MVSRRSGEAAAFPASALEVSFIIHLELKQNNFSSVFL